MKIGDKVRFLSESGGGRIAGFKGNNLVLVEDQDGFEIPMPINEVVVVGDEDYSTKRMVEVEQRNRAQEKAKEDKRSLRQRLNEGTDDAEARAKGQDAETVTAKDLAADDPSINFEPQPQERRGGDKPTVCLAFVPMDKQNFSTTRFESYLVNDSNYYVHFTYLVAEGSTWSLRQTGEVEPNTKLFLEEIGREQLNTMERLCIQLLLYKRQKTFLRLPAVDVQLRLDGVKFFKLNTFTDNDFFEQPALLYPVMEEGKPQNGFNVSAEELKSQLFGGNARPKEERKAVQPARHDNAAVLNDLAPEAVNPERGKLVKRYEPAQSKSRQVKQVLKNDKIIVDLHADQLLETTAGMSSGNILDYQLDVFRRVLDRYKTNKGQKIIFIHGKGEGVLRQAIIHELNYKYKHFQYQDASFQEYGYGATQVTIR